MEAQLTALYGDLNSFELTELILLIRSQMSTDMTINFSIFFGYLVVTYIAGKRLTSIQCVTFSILYSVIVLSATFQIYTDLSAINALQGILLGADVPFGRSLFQVSVMVIMWSLTLVYMYQTRRQAHGK